MPKDAVERHPLTYVRHQHGWSMDNLGRRIALAGRARGLHRDPGRERIYRWENGVEPDDLYQLLLGDVLGIDQDHILELGWPWWLPAFLVPQPFTPRGNRAALTEVLVALEHPDRRAFLALTTAGLVGLAANWAAIEPQRLTGALHGRTVDPTLLAWLEKGTDDLRALTNTNAPECTDLVHTLLKTVIQLISRGRYDQPTGRRLHQVAASASQCAGWLHFDQGEHAAAHRHWMGALHAAHDAADHDLGAGVLSDLAYAATWLDQPATAVQILEHARSRTHAPAARSLLDLRRARALARLGDAHNTGRTLISAENELDHARPGAAPAWVSWMSPADLTVDAGRCWLDLGQPDRAAASISQGLTLLDPARERTRAVVLAYRAEGALARHDLPAAAADARAALETARATNAVRCITLAHGTVNQLSPYRSHPAVQDLLAYARAS